MCCAGQCQAKVRPMPGKCQARVETTSKLVISGESAPSYVEKILSFMIHLWAPKICLRYREPSEPQWFCRSAISHKVCTKNQTDRGMIWPNKLEERFVCTIICIILLILLCTMLLLGHKSGIRMSAITKVRSDMLDHCILKQNNILLKGSKWNTLPPHFGEFFTRQILLFYLSLCLSMARYLLLYNSFQYPIVLHQNYGRITCEPCEDDS